MAEGAGTRFQRLARFAVIVLEAGAHRLAGRHSRTEGAHLLVHDEAGRILVVRPIYIPGEWMLPGGTVERDETPHRAGERETEEETGMLAVATRLLLIDARRRYNTSFVFAGELRGGTLQPQAGEIAAAAFVTRDEIRAASPRLEQLLRRIDEAGEGPIYLGIAPRS